MCCLLLKEHKFQQWLGFFHQKSVNSPFLRILIFKSPLENNHYGNDNPICKTEKETQMYRTDFWTLWEKARVRWSERTASKHVYYQVWNRSPDQVGCMRQMLGAGALGWPRGMGWEGRWEGGSGWGTHVNPWWFMSMYSKNHYKTVK